MSATSTSTGTGGGGGPDVAHLPVADRAEVRRAAFALIRADARSVAGMTCLYALAAAAGLVSPWLLGRIVDDVVAGARPSAVDRLAAVILLVALAQIVLTRYAGYVGSRFGERTQARVREQLVDRALALPAAVVERAGTGDLAARGTNDVAVVGTTLRDAAPAVVVAVLQAVFTAATVFALDPWLGACGVSGLVGIGLATRWYLRRARSAYLAEGAANSVLAEQLAANAAGARTIEALGLARRRRDAAEDAIAESRRAAHRTLFLRTVLYPGVDVSHVAPVVLILVVGGVLQAHGQVSVGTVVSCALYVQALTQPLNTILVWMEQLQSSGASFARVEGLAAVASAAPRAGGAAVPADYRIEVRGAYYAYRGGADVVSGVDLTVRPGERLAIVGPSGAGKTTLGRLLAGVDRPRAGTVTVGRVPVADLAPDELRRHVILVTQEQHVFLGTIRDNLRLAAPQATDAELHQALWTVGAGWVAELSRGLDTEVGGDGDPVDAARVQQLALARVVLADPHTVVLDEATALLDPHTARRAERALSAVLDGRTVVAIAHRLHTAHDADRVAVMEGGRLTEVGTHLELLERGGAYAALWNSWHGLAAADPAGGGDVAEN